MTEFQRLVHLTGVQGGETARQWARHIASVYLELIQNPQHYASQPEWKSIFEQSARDLNRFADTGVLPFEADAPGLPIP